MSNKPLDLVPKLENAQHQIWQTVSTTVSEAAGHSFTFGDQEVRIAKTTDLYGEATDALAFIQFAFSHTPESKQIVIIGRETVAQLASLARDEEVTEVDEDMVSDLRPIFEAIVQGICMAMGTMHSEPAVATGLMIRFQNLTFPRNFQKSEDLFRCRASAKGAGVDGEVVWLFDAECGAAIAGVAHSDRDDDSDHNKKAAAFEAGGHPMLPDGVPGLDILMDIPLEISVELGRSKMMVKDVLDLGTGSIVELNKIAGEPIDVMVNGRLVAHGEVVVIEDNFGVRITEVLSPFERFQRLNEAA